jgi:hypothetical protein
MNSVPAPTRLSTPRPFDEATAAAAVGGGSEQAYEGEGAAPPTGRCAATTARPVLLNLLLCLLLLLRRRRLWLLSDLLLPPPGLPPPRVRPGRCLLCLLDGVPDCLCRRRCTSACGSSGSARAPARPYHISQEQLTRGGAATGLDGEHVAGQMASEGHTRAPTLVRL